MNAILGACVGDAAGATLEFYHGPISEEVALKSMRMPGGGAHQVGPGQITDDGELTLALWQAIKDFNPINGLPEYNVITAYSNWEKSIPFDIGRTCSLAFEIATEAIESKEKLCEDDIILLKKGVYLVNKKSEANGALMRATAIATWVAQHVNLPAHLGAEIAMEDASLSHPSQICKETNAIYVFTLINLLRGIKPDSVIKYTDEFIELNDFSDKVKQWYYKDSLNIDQFDMKELAGHVRWGFILAFYFLRHPDISYEEAIKTTLMKGGDTDTNAAIVGGMVGTYHTIPDYMLLPVLTFDSTKQKIQRPPEYNVKRVLAGLNSNI